MRKFSNIKQPKLRRYALNTKGVDNSQNLRTSSNYRFSTGFKRSLPISQKYLLSSSYKGDYVETPSSRKQELREEKAEAANYKIAKEIVKKMRAPKTERAEVERARNMDELKQYIRGIATVCNRIKKGTVSRAQPKQKTKVGEFTCEERFMFEQLSFTETDEAKILAQRQILKQFDGSKQGYADNPLGVKIHKSKIMECLKLIDKIYRSMNQMEKLGYFKRSNKYMINYCKNTDLWMVDTFLYESKVKGQHFSLCTQYYVYSTRDQAKQIFCSFIAKGKKQLDIIHEELEEMLSYLGQVLGQKKLLELTKISQYIEQKLKKDERGVESSHNLRLNHLSREKLGINQHLQRIEQRFGYMKQISKVSRKRHEDLNLTYQHLHTLL